MSWNINGQLLAGFCICMVNCRHEFVIVICKHEFVMVNYKLEFVIVNYKHKFVMVNYMHELEWSIISMSLV